MPAISKGAARDAYAEREHGQVLPALTRYTVAEDTIQCECLGTTITFRLDDLKEISEDGEVVEVSFGSKGLCVIPLRAFQTPDEKITFITKIKNANQAVDSTATRVTPPADPSLRSGQESRHGQP
jgi:hypothetical protein